MSLEDARLKISNLADKLGMPIDENIKTLLIGLWVNNIETTGSCEGHLNWGEPFPWVDIETEEPTDFENNIHKQAQWKLANKKQSIEFKKLLKTYLDSQATPCIFNMWNRGQYGAVRFEIRNLIDELSKVSLTELQKQANDFGEYLITIRKEK